MPERSTRETREQHSRHVAKRKHPYLKIFLLVVLTFGFATGAYAFRLYSQAKTAVNATYKPVKNKKISTNIKNQKPLSILLLGVDTGAEGRIDKGNSDTMIVATVNPKSKQTNLVSVPRDTMARMQYDDPNKFDVQKVNAAYNIGSSQMAISTVEQLINVPIDYYVTINMGALAKIVNAVGGVDVQVPFSFDYDWQNFKKGPMHLNGAQALAYSRMRYQDPENDYGRQKRQQQVIKGIVNAAMSMKTLSNFETIMNTLSGSLMTNLSFDDMISIYENYRGASKNIKSDHLQGQNAWIGEASYQVAATKELQRVSNKLRTSLGLPTQTLDNEETKQNAKNPDFFSNPNNENYIVYTPSNDTVADDGGNVADNNNTDNSSLSGQNY